MDETAKTGRAARLLAVLVVLLGLLAMHGVASAHHVGATPAAERAAAPAAETSHQHAHGSTADIESAAQQDIRPLAGPTAPSCHDGCPSIEVLCVAVLAGAALALLLARRRASRLLLEPARRQTAPAPAPSVRHARPPDPVRELCVSRT